MRKPCYEKYEINKGAWSKQEDQKLIDYIQKHGEGCWNSLPHAAGLSRYGKSCRLRWINYLRPDLKRESIREDEEDLIIRLHALLGNRWSLIAGRLPGRTDNEVKNYWNTHIRKKLLKMGSTFDPKKPHHHNDPHLRKGTTATVPLLQPDTSSPISFALSSSDSMSTGAEIHSNKSGKPCCEKRKTNKGAWSKQEDEKLTQYVEKNGEGSWRSLPLAAGLLRCGKSCRLRWVNYLRPNVKRGNFGEDEEDLIIRLHALLGNRLTIVDASISAMILNHVYMHLHML
ncbi:unnamed protein product [Malus baccata var. baccata]